MVRNELAQGIADAIAGGALAGLSKEADMDFFGPFMQAQAQRLERTQQVNGRAYSAISDSLRALSGAAAADPEKYQAAMPERMDQIVNQINEQVTDPNLRQALLDQTEQVRSMYGADLSKQRKDSFIKGGMTGNFSWIDGSRESTDALGALFSPDAELGKRFARAQMLASNLGGRSGETLDLSAYPQGAIPSDLNQLLTTVNGVQGGLMQHAADNLEGARRLGEMLAKTDVTALEVAENDLIKVRDERNLLTRMGSMVKSNPDIAGLGTLVDRNLIQRSENGVFQFDDRAINQVADQVLKTSNGNATLALASLRKTFGQVPNFDLGNVTRAISKGGVNITTSPTDSATLIEGTFEAGQELLAVGIPNLNRADTQAVMRGDTGPLIEAGLSEEAAMQVLPLFQNRGEELVFKPIMDVAMGDDVTWQAKLENAQFALQDAIEQYGEESIFAQQAAMEVKQIAALQSRPALRSAVENLTRQTLRAAESGNWEALAASFARGTESGSLLDPEGLSAEAKLGLESAINPDAPLSTQLRQFKGWALGQGIVFRTGQPGMQATSEANAEAADLYSTVIDHWAGVLDAEQRSLSTEAATALGLETSDPFRPQRALLRLANIDSLSELTAQRPGVGSAFTKESLADAGISTLGMPEVLGSTGGKF